MTASDWNAGYALGIKHGYETALTELLHIALDRSRAGQDMLAPLPLFDELRARTDRALNPPEETP